MPLIIVCQWQTETVHTNSGGIKDLPYDNLVGRDIICHDHEMVVEQVGFNRSYGTGEQSVLKVVAKTNGKWRLCMDYRALNAVSIKNRYPMRILDEQLAKLSEYAGYDLCLLPGSDGREKQALTAFMTPDGLYEFNVMPFGLVNAVNEVITEIIRELNHQRSINNYVL